MKELLFFVTLVLAFIWVACWVSAELGDIRFYIGWSAPLIWMFAWGDSDVVDKLFK